MSRAMAGEDPFEVAIVDLMMPEMDGAAVAAAMRSDERLRDIAVILLTSAGHSDSAIPGVDVEIVKPVRPSQLFDMLQTMLSARGPEVGAEPYALAPHAGGARARARVLVVDDNAANQKVALRMVERLGYRGDVAATGAEAVNILGRGHYDAVLMDCQMPEMDGYEASRQIRHNERGGRRVPIIAMTADMVAGERERCLAAGVGGQITQTLKPEVVVRALVRVRT